MTDEELAARVLYCDALILVIGKPAGIAVHRGPKGGRISKAIRLRQLTRKE